MSKQFFRDYGYTQEEIINILSDIHDSIIYGDEIQTIETARKMDDIATILKKEWRIA